MSPQKRADLAAFIGSHELAVLSYLSPDGAPHSAVLAIAVTPDLEIVFDTVSTSRKYRDLRADRRCSLVVWTGELTLQYEGIAEEPSGEELDHYKEAYFKKLPDGRDRQSWPGIAYFVVRPTWIRYSDFVARPPVIEEFSF
jgi:pyridoxine/pyridoxamine 5'-phosphate oxidase